MLLKKSIYKRTQLVLLSGIISGVSFATDRPNIVIVYADDLGYGDVSCYGATKIETPNIDKLAESGLRFTNAHASSATCTPSRYSLLTGEYAWRKKGTQIAPGNASLIIPTNTITLPSMLQKAGYVTGAIGKWHLGLGGSEGPYWNGDIKPGPQEIGFNYSFIIPATGDRVPCVFVENQKVVGLDPNDPIKVDYLHPTGNEPTGKEHPELLKMQFSHGHDMTIVNGISRIGYMSGGKSALWNDENIAQTLTQKAVEFIEDNQEHPFFLYFATHDIHVPRVPNPQFVGKSGMGPRGDVILQLDWCLGEIISTLDKLGLRENTLIVFSSDNGPVVDDGYKDQAKELLNGHTPSGPLRGGKYSTFDAGTRVPFIVSWPSQIERKTVSNALVSQVDLFASFAALTGQKLNGAVAPDSFNSLPALLGKSEIARQYLVEHAGSLSIIKNDWKYTEPGNGKAYNPYTHAELGNSPEPQLYNLSIDIGEKNNLAKEYPLKLKELAGLLDSIKQRKNIRILN